MPFIGDDGDKVGARLAYKAAFMIQCLIMSNLLARDSTMRDTISLALRMSLPRSLSEPLAKAVDDPTSFPLPDKATISRWRVCLDAAFMLWCRRHTPPMNHIRYIMVDSSTQGGKDYELILVCSVVRAEMASLYLRANELISLRWLREAN